ncbi:hypothetical protein CCHR01_19803 [Colletotrichum chrysophilum]|uniref:Uncharacterized protein n=1 Tax=Colletotrichum chrysophilum TaxID=1836956 RepID=A0AAD8ZXY3_9PEZI|nr:hypothetical protein CCHR01_19803 [Colletotrichum chrysophilum]
MNAETPYLCVLVFNLGCWMLLTRVFPLIRWVEATFVIDRQLIKDANDTGLRFLSVHLDEALSKDDRSLNGFNPPRTLRFTVGLVVLIENLVVMLLPLEGDQTFLPREPQVHVLEVGFNTGSGTTTGEWYYFKVDNVPIRVARLERRERRDGAGYDLVAVLLMSRDAAATADPDVRGPYLIPLAAPVATNRPLRVIALDSGVVEAQQYLAWRCELKRVEAACTSLVWLNENPVFLRRGSQMSASKRDLKSVLCVLVAVGG